MALSGQVSVSVTTYNNLIFSWTAVQDAVKGISTVNWEMILESLEYGRIDATFGSPWEVTVDGKEFSGRTSIAVSNNSQKILASGSVELTHDENGEKSFTFTFSQALRITFAGEYIDTVSGEGSGVLNPIDLDAAPILEPAVAELGTAVTITPQGPAYAVYKLEYLVGGSSGIIAEGVSEPVEWTLPEALGAEFPYTEEATVRILCTAYIDGVRTGRQREAAITAVVPESAVPKITELSWTDVSNAAALGTLYQNVSKLKVEAECTGAMGSRVTSCAFYVNGKSYSGGVLEMAGEATLTAVATDSRGRTGSASTVLMLTAYQRPKVTLSAHRCLEDGTADDTGGYAKVSASVEVAEFDGNSGTGVFMAGTFTEEKEISGAQELEWILEAPTESTLGISLVVTDILSSGSDAMVLSTAYATLDLLYGGKGIAFGTTAMQEGFLCAMDATFTGKVSMSGAGIRLSDGTLLEDRLAEILAAINNL